MIVPKGPDFLRMVQYTGRPLLLLALYDTCIVVAFNLLHWKWIALPNIPLSLYGSAITIFVAFRNQSAYTRWWEARTLWGSIVNNARSWVRQIVSIHALRPEDRQSLEAMRRRLVYLQIAYVHAFRQHLRKLDVAAELPARLTAEDLALMQGQTNIPLALQVQMGKLVLLCKRNNWVDALQWQALDNTLNDLADAQGGCERIKNTPIPKQYDYFPKLFVHIYCVLLPLALVNTMGWFTPLGSTLIGFIFLTLDRIGRDLEDPFDNTVYDIPLTSITRNIEINLRQMLGEIDLPTPEAPIHGVLW